MLLGPLEFVIDLSMKVEGVYLFFFKLDHVNGAIVLACSMVWTLGIIASRFMQKYKPTMMVSVNAKDLDEIINSQKQEK
jgi:hypothetical protein